jgi:hypothetical protein
LSVMSAIGGLYWCPRQVFMTVALEDLIWSCTSLDWTECSPQWNGMGLTQL